MKMTLPRRDAGRSTTRGIADVADRRPSFQTPYQNHTMDRVPKYRRIKPDELGRVLDKRRIRRFYVLMLPILLPIGAGAAGGLVLGFMEGPDANPLGISLICLAAVLFAVYLVFESFLIGYYPANCYLRWLRERIDRRTDAVVASDDPDALFVQIIPREKWEVSMGENASDVGLLLLDHKKRELRYEGDLERWTVPTECVRAFRLHSFTPPGSPSLMQKFTVVDLIVEDEDGKTWETPLACHPIQFELWTPGKRRVRAQILRELIGNLVDSKQWPAVDEEDFRGIRAPAPR